jgi:DNA mismatch repair protein MutS
MNKDDKKKVTKGNIHDEYLFYHEKFQNKYGDKTIVLMQVGSFHEAYGTNERGPNLFKLSELLNIVCTRKDKSIDIINEKNPYMLGFPSVALSKFLKILIDHHFTVIVIDQTTPVPNPQRSVTGIYSPSTFIDGNTVDSKYLMVLYIEVNKSLNSSKNNISIGMCAIDSSTAAVSYYESHGSGLSDENEATEEAQRYYHYYRPAELLVYMIDNTKQENTNIINIDVDKPKKNKILDRIDILPNQIMFSFDKINPNFTKLSYQNTLLAKVYPSSNSLITPIEFFDLAKMPYSITALVTGFDYIHQHNENLIKELQVPTYFDEHKYMILGNNAQYQLNIVDYYNYDTINVKYQSLNDVINNCVTPMGKRNLKQRLCAPYTNATTINNLYELTDKLVKSDQTDTVRSYLKSIADLDKLFRKIAIKFIQPYELHNIYTSFESIVQIIQNLVKTNLKTDIIKMFDKKDIILFNQCIGWIEETFCVDKLKINNLIEVKESFYNENVHEHIDLVQKKILSGNNFLNKLVEVLQAYDPDITLHIKYNERDGYYIQTTKIRGNKLKKLIEKETEIKIDEHTTISATDLLFSELTGTMKITSGNLNTHSAQMDDLYTELNNLVKTQFYQDIQSWYNKYSIMFKKLINLIVQIDLVSNNSYTSKRYHYVKPRITNTNTNNQTNTNITESFINAKKLRHPIIERIIDYEYVPHDIMLNNETRGLMIYGPNSAGKSSIMKAIGICLIMAQCGLYVPCEDFEFNTFTALYTRISGGDNLFKGHSSFVVEMNELRTILKKSDHNTLVIGDEVAKGSDYVSATAIVSATVVKLSKMGVKYLFATHLHDLPNMKVIKELNNIRFVYLSVEQINGELIFSRKMLDGTGESVYGITIAKFILDDPEFINTAIDFKNELLEKQGINYKLVNDKKSLYNSNIYVDHCFICNSEEKLESHHINFQKDFKNSINGLINEKKQHLLKDDKANLIVLCGICHDKLHANEITIKSKVKTSNGIKIIE